MLGSPASFKKNFGVLLGTNLCMGLGFHPESFGQVEIFNQLLEQTLRCTVHQLGETRNWVEVLPTIEFAVNNTPNRTTGHSAFYLNYGYHLFTPCSYYIHLRRLTLRQWFSLHPECRTSLTWHSSSCSEPGNR